MTPPDADDVLRQQAVPQRRRSRVLASPGPGCVFSPSQHPVDMMRSRRPLRWPLLFMLLWTPGSLHGSKLETAPAHAAELSTVVGGPLRCVAHDFVELSVYMEKGLAAGRPTEQDIRQAIEVACREVGGCWRAEAEQAQSFVARYWEEEYERQAQEAMAKRFRVLTSRFKYVMDRSVTIAYNSLFMDHQQPTRIRLSPSGDVDSAVAVFCHQQGLQRDHPVCAEAAYYVRAVRKGQPWCQHHKETITSFTRRLLDPQASHTSAFTDLVRRSALSSLDKPASVAKAGPGGGNGTLTAVEEGSSGMLMAGARWRAWLEPAPGVDEAGRHCYGPNLPLRIELGWEEGGGGVLGVDDVAGLLEGPVLLAYRLSGCDWTIVPVLPRHQGGGGSLVINASCEARPLHHDDVRGRRLVAVQLFESLRLQPISDMMVVAGRQCQPPPPEVRVTPAPPAAVGEEDAAVLGQVVGQLMAHDRGQQVVSSFYEVYAGFSNYNSMSGVSLPLRFFYDTERHLLHLQACERISHADLGVDAFVSCMHQMRPRVEQHLQEEEAKGLRPRRIGLRSAMLRVSQLEQVLSEALVEEGRSGRGRGWSWDRFSRLRTLLEELILPSWEVLVNTTSTDKLTYHGYHRFYGPAFEEFRRRPMRMMELGSKDASVLFWPRVFPEGNLTFVDLLFKETCRPCRLGDGATGYHIDLHDEHDVAWLADEFSGDEAKMDVIIDDASHVPEAQVVAFRHLFERALKPGGIFVIEDVETSYHHENKHVDIFPHFTSLINTINREFIDPLLGYGPLSPAASLVSSITFGHNCIILRKKDDVSEPFEGRLYRSRHLMHNYTIGGMREHEASRALHIERGPMQPPPGIATTAELWGMQWHRVLGMASGLAASVV